MRLNAGKSTPTRWGKWLLILLLTVVGTAVLLFSVMFAYVAFVPSDEDYAHRLDFDADAWRKRAFDEDPLWPTRLRMVDDLVADKRLDRLTRREVEALLGARDDTDWAA